MITQTFESGDLIEFCNDKFIVIENYGKHGRVREHNSNTTINNFYWEIGNDKCKLIKKEDNHDRNR